MCLGALPFLALLFLLGIVMVWSIKRSLRPAPDAFSGNESFHSRDSGQVMLGSYRIRFSYEPPKRVKNGILKRKIEISLEKISPVTLYLYAQTPIDEWLFRFGFAHEMALGIPWLDRQFNISTSDESAARKFLAREDVQNLLRKLISPSFISFSIEPKAYSIALEDFDPQVFENLNQMVLTFGRHLADFFPAVHENFLNSSMSKATRLSRVHGWLQNPALTAFLFVVLVAIYIGLVFFYKKYEPVHALDTLLLFSSWALGIFAGLLFILRPLFHKMSFPGREIKNVAILFLVSTWTMTLAALLFVNVKLDQSPTQKVSERVLSKWISYSSKSRTRHYMIHFEAPTPAHIAIQKDIVESELRYQEWEKINPGKDFIYLELRQGYFGAPWIQAHWFGEKNNWSE